jgi:periplasmic protein TonB
MNAVTQTLPCFAGRTRQKHADALDLRRIAALACVVILHVLLIGAILRPVPPEPTEYVPRDTFAPPTWVELSPPPPPPPKVLEPVKTLPVQTQPIPTPPKEAPVSPPAEAVEPNLIAMTETPSDEPGLQSNFVEPTPALGGPPVQAALRLLLAPPPPYPRKEEINHVEGTVTFRVLVGADGKASDIELVKSSGSKALDRAALSHIKRKWRFQPASTDGDARAAWGVGSVSFQIGG